MLGTQRSANVLTPVFAKQWAPHVALELDSSRYVVATAQTKAELMEVIQLRRRVFQSSFTGAQLESCLELDEYDVHADMLYVRSKETGMVVASYRLLHSKTAIKFYSVSEFDLFDFLDRTGEKLELSRACVDPEYRSGAVIHLLWRGIAAYMSATKTDFLFGLSSLSTTDIQSVQETYQYLEAMGYLGHDYEVVPKKGYQLKGFELRAPEAACRQPEGFPPLLKAYLKAGAKVYGPPAFDPAFCCVDLFTILDFATLGTGHRRKYLNA